MTSRLSLHLLAALFMWTGCDVEPAPNLTHISAGIGQGVTLRGQSVPAKDVEWLIVERPLSTAGDFVWEDLEEANFVPNEGEYVIDRWVQSGPAQVLTDRFIVHAQGYLPGLRLSGPGELGAGLPGEYEVVLREPGEELDGLTILWNLRSKQERGQIGIQQISESGDRATCILNEVGNYTLSVRGIYNQGETSQQTRNIQVR